MPMQSVEGGCHCGAVRYRAQADVGRAMQCNCSHCSAKGLILTFTPASDFELVSGDGELSEYLFNRHEIAHVFCRSCGVQPFARGQMEGVAMTALNVRTFDGLDVATLNPTQVDGRSF